MKTAALLLRCSTDAQDYERQKLDLLDATQRLGYQTSDELIFGQYITGKDNVRNKDRESIALCKQAVLEKRVDAIFINEVSRLSRDSIAGRLFIREFNHDYKIPIYFRDLAKWTIDPNTQIIDSGFQTMLGFYFDMAENELKSMKTRLASGKRRNAREGKTIGGATPFGFYKDEQGKLQIKEDEAQIVKLIYSKYLENGGSIPVVCRFLIASGYNKKFNCKFGSGTIRNILTERRYIGEQVYNLTNPDEPDETKAKEVYVYKFDAIIDVDIYNKVQIKLATNRTGETKKQNRERKVHLLGKLIICPICNNSFTSKTASSNYRGIKKKVWTYCCVSKYNNIDCNSSITFNAEKLESIIWQLTKKELLALQELSLEERLEKISKTEETITSYKEELETISKNINKLNNKKKKLLAFMLEDDSDDDLEIFNEQKESINKEIESHNNRINYLNTEINIAESNIARFKEMDFTDDILDSFEQNPLRQKEIIKDCIIVIRPYRVNNSKLLLEVETKQNSYFLLYEPRNSQRICWYINASLANWQNSKLKCPTTPSGNFFYVPIASILLSEDTEDLDTIVSYDEMIDICRTNNYEINY